MDGPSAFVGSAGYLGAKSVWRNAAMSRDSNPDIQDVVPC